ncbi:XAC2610-related protein [Flavobacterium terrae]|uniref:Uncharacterized protein n=1 Tax=Flavobacterium terrae TaxID=415425 RepID=A0A1M6G0Y0_9FLAO|nr:hypothetical protein [Flavobacterium terrae]SHJ03603.1 hypothetical protein SAMN05444363_2455 [Flavobacterium terrae]
MKKIFLSIIIGLLVSNCKKEKTNVKSKIVVPKTETLSKHQSNNSVKLKEESSKDEKESFVFSCGTGCAIVYDEMSRKRKENSIEIKYTVTQYINDNAENESFKTYIFESDEKGYLKSIHLINNQINLLNDDSFIWKEKFTEIGIELFPKGLISNSLFKKFEFKYTVTEVETEEDTKYLIKINLRDKETNKIQKIDFTPENLYNKNLNLNTSSHSYFNPNQSLIKASEGIERYHDLIVLDYNFDGLEDFAIINYEGSNGGPQFAYFKQNSKKQFELDESFTNEIRFFPLEMNQKEKTLEFGHPSGCCQINTFIVKILPKEKWKVIYTKLEDI